MIPTAVRRVDELRRSGRRHLRLRAAVVAMTLTTMLLGTALIAAAESPVSRPDRSTTDVPAMTGRIADHLRTDDAIVAPDHSTTLRPPLFLEAKAMVVGASGRSPFARPFLAPRPALPKAVAVAHPTRLRARGDATWYCVRGISPCHRNHAGGMYAAAGAALRVGDWRGRVVSVCQGGDCVRVKLIDWCACGGGRVIDLYGDAFRKLAPLSSGELRVGVRW
jgi:hypothetical protein